MPEHEKTLLSIVRDCSWLMQALHAARSLKLDSWCVAAGAVRNIVWDRLHDKPACVPDDIDLIHFDSIDTTRSRDKALETQLVTLAPDLPWQVTNQAGVHLWYAERFGREIAALRSLEDGMANWPETATAVGVWLDAHDGLHVVAPFGLHDLFALRLRHNASRTDRDTYLRRVTDKGFLQRWPRLNEVAPHRVPLNGFAE